MISHRRFLIDPPRVVDVHQRLKYESIALATHIIELSMAEIERSALAMVTENQINPQVSYSERAQLFAQAWEIVDQAYLISRLLRSEEGIREHLASSREFEAEARKSRAVRNWMDHFDARIPGYVEKSGSLPPAHGALSFTVIDPAIAPAGTIVPLGACDYKTVVVLSTGMQRPLQVAGVPEEYPSFRVPIDNFFLQAFGEHVSLTRLTAAASSFCDELAAVVENFLREKARRFSADTGHPEDEYLLGSEFPACVLVMEATRMDKGNGHVAEKQN